MLAAQSYAKLFRIKKNSFIELPIMICAIPLFMRRETRRPWWSCVYVFIPVYTWICVCVCRFTWIVS